MEVQKRKVFEVTGGDGEKIKLAIKRPTQDLINEADLEYNVKISNCIKRGVMTRAEAESLMREKGIWTEEDEKQLRKMREEARNLEKKLALKGLSKEKGTKYSKQLREKRSQMLGLINKRNSYSQYTAESLAESTRDQYLTYACTVYADTEENYFESFEDFCNRVNEPAAILAYQQAIYFFNNIDENIEMSRAENRYMVDNKMMDEDGYFLNEEGKRVDSGGRRINENFEYVIDFNDEEVRCDEFGNPINEDGSPNMEKLKEINPEEYERIAGEE